jgi:hypothetical protein
MKHFFEQIHLSTPKFSFFIGVFQNPTIAITSLTTAVVATPVVDFWSSVYLLGFFFIGDLVTGILASYFTWKKETGKTDKWFFGKGEGFSSDKFKKMFVKLMIYLGAPCVLQYFQNTFKIHNLKYAVVSDAEFTVATALILIFCLNEGFSIFHENLPKCGFNLWKSIKEMIGFYKEAKKELNE